MEEGKLLNTKVAIKMNIRLPAHHTNANLPHLPMSITIPKHAWI